MAMKFLIHDIQTRSGRPTDDRVIRSTTLRIGRAEDADLQLDDVRIAAHHAQIVGTDAGDYSLNLEGDCTALHNGRPAISGVVLKSGDRLQIGRFELVLKAGKKGLVVGVRDTGGKRDPAAQLRHKARLHLEDGGLSKRRLAYALLIPILIVGLLLPLGLRQLDGGYDALKQLPLIPDDRAWLSGPISAAHTAFGMDCKACHTDLFRRVKDETCLECHAPLAHHADSAEMMQATGLDETRCASCHHEHAGNDMLVIRHPGQCTSCHAEDIEGSSLLPASDFAQAHPEFSPTITIGTWGEKVESRSLPWTDLPPEGDASSLIFPHDLHLDEAGVETSSGEIEQLRCGSCHEKQMGGVSFQPVSMQNHCARCHALDFDPDDPDARLPHGDTAAAIQALRGHFAQQVLQGVDDQPPQRSDRGRIRQRDGQMRFGQDDDLQSLWAEARQRADLAISEAFSARSCAKCHLVSPPDSQDGVWTVHPFHQRPRWFESARFDHATHTSVSCLNCHEGASTSKDANDVLLPKIKDCQSCHGGNVAQSGLLQSRCVDCHGFHEADDLNMGAPPHLAVHPVVP